MTAAATRCTTRRRPRAAAAATLTVAASMAVVLYPQTASAATTEVRLVRLICHQTEDSAGADEAILTYNGQHVWNGSINDGQAAEIGAVKPISSQAAVSLYDEDWPDADDYLGTVWIGEWERDQGLRFQDFTLDDAHYTLVYRVVAGYDD